jgi:hypothetical protein
MPVPFDRDSIALSYGALVPGESAVVLGNYGYGPGNKFPYDMSGYGEVVLRVVIGGEPTFTTQPEIVIWGYSGQRPTATQHVVVPVIAGSGRETSVAFKVSPLPRYMGIGVYNRGMTPFGYILIAEVQYLSDTAVPMPEYVETPS